MKKVEEEEEEEEEEEHVLRYTFQIRKVPFERANNHKKHKHKAKHVNAAASRAAWCGVQRKRATQAMEGIVYASETRKQQDTRQKKKDSSFPLPPSFLSPDQAKQTHKHSHTQSLTHSLTFLQPYRGVEMKSKGEDRPTSMQNEKCGQYKACSLVPWPALIFTHAALAQH